MAVNHGKLPQLAASTGALSEICPGIFRIVARKDSRRLALDFQTLRPIIYFSAASAKTSACVCEVFGTISDSVGLRTCLVYCRTFGLNAKVSFNGGGGARDQCGISYQRVRRNGCKPIWLTSAVLLGLVFRCQWDKHEGFVQYFLRFRSNETEKRVIFF